MITTNPFNDIVAAIPADYMQYYVILMVLMVIGGTILDTIHKKSAQYFFENSKKAEKAAKRSVGGGEKMSLAIKTVASEVLTSSEFASSKRRMSHLLTMYGFVTFVAMTAILIFSYTGTEAPAPELFSILWHVGAAMIAAGGYWFWFSIRVDVSSEGVSWYRLKRADIFIVSLLATSTFALLWSWSNSNWILFTLFIISSTTLFSTVLWSKFAHMFFKPAAAYQKRVTKADGSRENLPELADRTNPADSDRHSMELLKDAPLDMGLGIKRDAPRHY